MSDPNAMLDIAYQAQAAGKWDEALSSWQVLRERFPRRAILGMGLALRQLKRLDEADVLLKEGVDSFPDDVEIGILYPIIAQRRSDWTEALRRWRSAQNSLSDNPAIREGIGRALTELDRLDEAEEYLKTAAEKFRDNPGVIQNYAVVAQRRQDWHNAEKRWRSVHERFPHRCEAFIGLGTALRELGRLDDADSIVVDGISRYPKNGELAGLYSSIAQRRRDWPEMLRRWQQTGDHFPVRAAVGIGTALRELGRFEEADVILSAATNKYPKSTEIAVTHASIAQARGDWTAALKRWREVQRRFPENRAAEEGVARAEGELATVQDMAPTASLAGSSDTGLAVTDEAPSIASANPQLSDRNPRQISGRKVEPDSELRAAMRRFVSRELNASRRSARISTTPRILRLPKRAIRIIGRYIRWNFSR